MIPAFGGDLRKRKINLGGASSSSTSASILSQVQQERQARAEKKQRADAAVRIQSVWRGYWEGRRMRDGLKKLFEEERVGGGGPGSVKALRCLVLIGRDEEVLGKWAKAVVASGPDRLLAPAISSNGEDRTSWLVLIRQVLLLLLRSVAESPSSQNAIPYLQVLSSLLSLEVCTKILGPKEGNVLCTNITTYLLEKGYYKMIRESIIGVPVSAKSTPSLPLLLTLSTHPLSTYAPSSQSQHTHILSYIYTSILSIPLLPNRLPISHLPTFIAHLRFSSLNLLQPVLADIMERMTGEDKVHLAATLWMFVSPNYRMLNPKAMSTYLRMCIGLFEGFPDGVFDEKGKIKNGKTNKNKKAKTAGLGMLNSRPSPDSDIEMTDSSSTKVRVVSEFMTLPPPKRVIVDDKTYKRLSSIPSPTHLTSLVGATRTRAELFPLLVQYLFEVTLVWEGKGDEVLNVILAGAGASAAGGGGLVRELYRELVRRSPLGRDEGGGGVLDPANATHYPPLLLLSDLYSQALLTMGDDEFFGRSSGSSTGYGSGPMGNGSLSRNPLTLDELVAFSKQLLNLAFVLYWRDDGTNMRRSVTGSQGQDGGRRGRLTWEVVREKVTKCLVGIHARDSRKPFVPPDHWLVTSQLDMNSFVEAAILEEQQLSQSSSDSPSSSHHHLAIHPRSLTKRQLASISPRLGILNNIPFAIPFEVRVSIFRHFVMNDMVAHAAAAASGGGGGGMTGMLGVRGGRYGWGARPKVSVRRGMVAQDGFDRLGDMDLKQPVEIAFIDQWGEEEAGIDGGGVFKEFFTSLVQEVFDTDRGLWLANTRNELYPNPHAYATESHSLNWYRFIGRILGKAMYEGILVDVGFAGFFLAKWLGRQSFLDDLASLDPELYNGLIFLKHHTGNVEDLALNFTISVEEFGVTKTIDLIPDGSNIAVTNQNRLMYIYLVSNYRLNKQIKKQSEAFFEGLSEMIDSKWLRMFNQQEVQILIGGVNAPVDLDDLRKHTNYGGLYDDEHEVIRMFWKVMNSFDQEQRRALLRFVTSCSRPPLLGFKELVPNFCIRDAGSDQHRLPTSSTCVNLLKLPRYADEKTLRVKLLQAINSGAGFDLS